MPEPESDSEYTFTGALDIDAPSRVSLTSRSSIHRKALIRYRCYRRNTDSPRQQHAKITTSILENPSLSLDPA